MLLQALRNRECGQTPHKHLAKWCTERFTGNIDVSFRTFESDVVKKNITCIDLESAECRYVLVGYGNGNMSIYDVESTHSKTEFPMVAAINQSVPGAHKFSVDSIQWYPHDTGMFLSLSADKTVKVWDTNELRVAERFPFTHDVYSFHMSEKARKHSTVAVACKDWNIYLVDLRSGNKLHSLKGHKGSVFDVKWSPRNDNIVCSGGSDGQVLMWDSRKVKSYLASLKCEDLIHHNIQVAHQGCITGLCFSNDGFNLLSYGPDGLKLWDLVSEEDSGVVFKYVNNTNRRTVQIGISKNLKNDVVYVPSDVDIKVFDVATGEDKSTLRGHYMKVNCCYFNPVQQELYSGASDTQILSWKYQDISSCGNEGFYTDSWSDNDDGDDDDDDFELPTK